LQYRNIRQTCTLTAAESTRWYCSDGRMSTCLATHLDYN